MRELSLLVIRYWPYAVALGLALVAIRWVVLPAAAFLLRGLRSRWPAKGRAPWFWGRRLNIRTGGEGSNRRERCLVVFVHGLFPYLAERWMYRRLIDHFDDVLQSQFARREYLLFSHHGTYWSPRDPEWIVREQLLPQIAAATSRTDYDAIILTAHSFGGLLVRQLVLDAAAEPWYDKIERIVLMASPNRGFTAVTMLQKVLELFAWAMLDRPENPAWLRFGHLTLAGLKGAPWVSDLRLRWITAFSSGNPPPLTFQILGGRDSLVSVDDDDDLRKFANFHPKLLPLIGHGHFSLELRQRRTPELNDRNAQAMAELQEVIAQALTLPDFLRALAAPPAEVPDHIVLIVHGIRDFAEWHEELSDAIQRLNVDAADGVRGPQYQAHSIGYGYFSAYQFLSNRARQYCVRTLVDRYVQLRIKFPDATFHAIAHSNGTYAVGRALQDYRFVRFERVYFAGSVLSEHFDWQQLLRSERKTLRVMNLCADGDTPVGVLCWALSSLRMVYGSLGVGGSAGFGQATDDLGATPPAESPLAWNEWIVGDHNSGVRRNNFQNIAEFIRTGLPQRERPFDPDEMPIERITDPARRTSRAVHAARTRLALLAVVAFGLYVGAFFFIPWAVIVSITLGIVFVVAVIDFLLVF